MIIKTMSLNNDNNDCEESLKVENKLDDKVSTLNFFEKLGFSLGHVFNDLCATVWFSYTLLFFKHVLQMPNEAGSFMMLGQISDAIFASIVGVMTDKFSTKRNWHIFGTVIVLLSFPLIFMMHKDILPYGGTIFYFIFFIMLFQLGWPICQITHLAMIPELSRTQKDRDELNSIRYSTSIFSNIAVFIVAWIILQWKGQNRAPDQIGPDDFPKFQNIATLLTSVGVAMSIIFYISLSMSNYNERRQTKSKKCTELSAKGIKKTKVEISTVLLTPDLYRNAFLYMCSRLFVVICIIYIPIWLNEFMKYRSDQTIENIAIIPLVFFITSFIAAFIVRFLNNKLSHKALYAAGSVICIIGCIWIGTSKTLTNTEILGMAIMFGAGSSINQISSLCIVADFVGEHSEHGGLIYSIVTVCDKLISGIVIFLIENFECDTDYYGNVLAFNGFAAFAGLLIIFISIR